MQYRGNPDDDYCVTWVESWVVTIFETICVFNIIHVSKFLVLNFEMKFRDIKSNINTKQQEYDTGTKRKWVTQKFTSGARGD